MQLIRFEPNAPASETFVGRRSELASLDEWWRSRSESPVFVSGPAGVGKTTLVRVFTSGLGASAAYASIRTELLSPRVVLDEAAGRLAAESIGTKRQGLVVLDDVDRVRDSELLFSLGEYLRREWPHLRGIAVGRRRPESAEWHRLELGPLDPHAVRELLARIPGLDRNTLARIAKLTEGNPLLAQLVGTRLQEGDGPAAVGEILRGLRWDERSLLSGVRSDDLAARLDIKVQAVSDALIRRLAAEPELMYELRPRQLEELMAELYSREGFDVELTPETRDGGVDLYLVEHTAFGCLLTIVDCKRKKKGLPVGVAVVRQMLGTIEAVGASAGVLATTSRYTSGAVQLGAQYPFRLGLQDYFDLHQMLRRASGDA